MNKNIVIAVLSVLVIVFAGLYFFTPRPSPLAGSYHTNEEEFLAEIRAPLVETGDITTLTAQATSTAVTLTAAQVCDSNQIRWDITTVSTTLNLPTVANTVANCLTKNGDRVSFWFANVSTSTGAIVTIASSTWELVGVGAGSDLIDGANQAKVTLIRTSATAGYAILEEFIAAD